MGCRTLVRKKFNLDDEATAVKLTAEHLVIELQLQQAAPATKDDSYSFLARASIVPQFKGKVIDGLNSALDALTVPPHSAKETGPPTMDSVIAMATAAANNEKCR